MRSRSYGHSPANRRLLRQQNGVVSLERFRVVSLSVFSSYGINTERYNENMGEKPKFVVPMLYP